MHDTKEEKDIESKEEEINKDLARWPHFKKHFCHLFVVWPVEVQFKYVILVSV